MFSPVRQQIRLAKLTILYKMACPVCGKSSPCAHETTRSSVLLEPRQEYHASQPAALPNDQFWRDEVISRVQQHRARRRKRSDNDADGTMELNFQPAEPLQNEPEAAAEPAPPPPMPVYKPEPPKIIAFPRPIAVQPAVLPPQPRVPIEDFELATPVLDTPRILDAPEPAAEQMDLLSSFADIRLEPEESRKNFEEELPIRPAPLQQRVFAGLVDALVVLIASAIFAITFTIMSSGLPQTRMVLLCGAMVAATFWLLYQYLFLVYSSGTPGMQMAQLELCTFKGEPVSVTLRRWRAVASLLSGCSIGLGFAWAFVDEDTLGWHDRITQTHLREQSAIQ